MLKFVLLLVGFDFMITVTAESPYRPKTTSGVNCKIPFEYNGNRYYDCTIGNLNPWCYTNGSDWGYCEATPDFSKCEMANPTVNASEVELIIDLLNNMRSREPALRMAKIKWNTELAMRAQFMSNLCEMGNANTKLCSSAGNMGQISYMSMSNLPMDPQWMPFLLEFYSKKPAYNIDSNECSVKYCNGYKQIVNAATMFVGCARTSCQKTGMYADYYFCNFYPPIYSGRPYDQGAGRCDSCYKLDNTKSFRCDNSLCDICDGPAADCQGKEQMMDQIARGVICEDLDPGFCSVNAAVCKYLEVLPTASKQMLSTQCKKTCNLC